MRKGMKTRKNKENRNILKKKRTQRNNGGGGKKNTLTKKKTPPKIESLVEETQTPEQQTLKDKNE
jgi:hypothetical protein